jgi:hypothetical protein
MNPGFVIGENFVGRADAFLGSAFHVALEVDGAVFPSEMAISGAFPLGSGKARILAGFPVGV